VPALTTYPALEYTGWGETVASGSDVGVLNQPFQYDGRDGVEYDAMLGMNWMRARHYSPTQGQFVQADPLPAQPGTPDTAYSYAAGDPVNHVDPSGQYTFKRSAAANWAENHIHDHPLQYDVPTSSQCTNYLSRILHSGGRIPETDRAYMCIPGVGCYPDYQDTSTWHYDDILERTTSWINVNDSYDYWVKKSHRAKSVGSPIRAYESSKKLKKDLKSAKRGDALYANWHGSSE